MLDLGTLQLGVKIDDGQAKGQLQGLGGEVEKTGSKTEMLAGKAKMMIKAFVAAYAIQEIAKLGKAALDAYAQFEQLQGGVDKIFGKEAAETVMQNASNAYKTAGMSANQYMETVTSFSASLIQSMGGNTEAAAGVADMAIRDMSDNANTFGTNMQSIQDAYQGFAKQNYTMLDNLKLGYGGTKEEMQRLLQDAEKLTGKKYDISNLNDVYEAIHAIQEEYNITGTTSKEASHTIEGSMNALKAAGENMLTAIGGGGNMDKAFSALLQSAADAAKNIIPRVFIILKNVVVGVIKYLPQLMTYISDGIGKLADMIGSAGSSGGGQFAAAALTLLKNFAIGMIKAIPQLNASIVMLVWSLAKYIISNAGTFIETGKQMIIKLVTGFLAGHPLLQKAAAKYINGVFMPLQKIIKIVTKVVTTLHGWWKKLLGQKGSKKYSISAPFSKALQSMKDIFSKWKDILGQKAKKTFEVAKKGFTSVLNSMKDIYNKWKDILGQAAKKVFKIETKGKPPGSRIGLREVPYDGYVATLHKGEAVLTAAEVNRMNKQSETAESGGKALTVNVYGSDNMSVTELAAAVERRIINMQKRRSNAWA